MDARRKGGCIERNGRGAVCNALDGRGGVCAMRVQAEEARATRFVNWLGEQFNAWIQVEEGPNDAQA